MPWPTKKGEHKDAGEVPANDYKDDIEDRRVRREIDNEYRGLWEKIVIIDVGILGIVLPLVSSWEGQTLLYPRLTYGAFFVVLLLGIFLIWLDNRRRLFLLDFTKITHRQAKEILNGISDDKRGEMFEVFRIEKRYGFSKYLDGFSIIEEYLKPQTEQEKKLYRMLDHYWPKHELQETKFMRFLYLIEQRLVFIFYLIFITGIVLLSLDIFLR